MRIGLTLRVGERAFDVLIEGPAGVALADVSERLCAIGGVRRGTPLWCAGARLDPAARIGLPPLLHGAVLSVGGPDAAGTPALAGPALAVVCGPGAGSVRPLRQGSLRVGRAAGVDLRLDDPDVSRTHAELTVDQDGVTVADLGSANGTALAGRGVGSVAVPFGEGDLLRVGETVLTLVAPTAGRACARPDGAGYLAVNTPPSISGPQRWARVEFPTEPAAPPPTRLQPIALLLPLVIAVPAALWWGPTMLLFLVLSPVLMLGNYLGDRASGRRTRRHNEAAYRLELEAAEVRLAKALHAEARARRAEAPDPAYVARTAEGPGPRLWERPHDGDALTIRLGLADLPARTTVAGAPERAATPIVTDVPVTVGLQACGVLGLAGPRPRALEVVRAMILQLAVTHGPGDLRLAVVCAAGTDTHADWAWTRWLPHGWPAEDAAADPANLPDRVAAFVRLLDARRAAAHQRGAGPQRPAPQVVLVLDDARALRELPGVARLLLEGPAHGLHAICLGEEACALPAECGATAVLHGETGTRLEVRVAGAEAVPNALADLVGAAHAEAVARALARLRDATPPGADAALPDRVRLVDLLGLPDPAGSSDELADALVDRWSSTAGSMRAVIGVGPAGPVAVDLGEDGPHGLVAGTTGAGKSELLQTLVASLAVANRPDELSFLLVDYKGGAAFAECSGLPHTTGMVTDLDPHLTARALRSMDAELRRRERFLAAAGCADLAAYQDAGRSRGPLGRLLIVVDEFAALAAELPDFVSGLVDIARRGRSLGVHLLLATQRPAGVVTAEIRANTALRIALRVTDPEESRDVVDCADAAAIPPSTPGRAYLRTAEGPAVPFQTARVGGPPPGPRRTGITVMPWGSSAEPSAAPVIGGARPTSDLAALAAAARRAADRLHVSTPPSPWLPPLPVLLPDTGLAGVVEPADAAAGGRTLAIGVLDLPAEQAYARLGLDLTGGGHWAFVGGPRTGRSTALRTLAVEAARRGGDVHVYAFDFGGGGLRAIGPLDCCGAVTGRDDVERSVRLIDRLGVEVTRRQDLLTKAGLGSVADQQETAVALEPLPWMLMLIDGWEALAAALTELDPVTGTDRLLRLLQDGPAAGLHVAITGGRELLTGRVASLVTHRAMLSLPDRLDYGVAGIAPRDVPDRMPPGRALIPTVKGVLEAQLVLPGAGVGGDGEAAFLARRGAAMTGRASGFPRPLRVEELPTRLSWASACAKALEQQAETGTAADLWTLVGLGGDDLRPLGLDPREDGPVLVVAGPGRSGRSTALAAIARWHGERGVPVIAIAQRRSPLWAVAGSPDGPEGPWLTDGGDPQMLQRLIAAARGRGVRRAVGPLVVLVDAAEQVADTATGDLLAELVDAPEASDLLVVVAGTAETFASAYRGFGAAARKSGCALLLGRCGVAEADLAGTPLPRTVAGPPGRGLLAVHGVVTALQVPLP